MGIDQKSKDKKAHRDKKAHKDKKAHRENVRFVEANYNY